MSWLWCHIQNCSASHSWSHLQREMSLLYNKSLPRHMMATVLISTMLVYPSNYKMPTSIQKHCKLPNMLPQLYILTIFSWVKLNAYVGYDRGYHKATPIFLSFALQQNQVLAWFKKEFYALHGSQWLPWWYIVPNQITIFSRLYIPDIGLIFRIRLTRLWSNFFYNNAFPYRLY